MLLPRHVKIGRELEGRAGVGGTGFPAGEITLAPSLHLRIFYPMGGARRGGNGGSGGSSSPWKLSCLSPG